MGFDDVAGCWPDLVARLERTHALTGWARAEPAHRDHPTAPVPMRGRCAPCALRTPLSARRLSAHAGASAVTPDAWLVLAAPTTNRGLPRTRPRTCSPT
jgi:hypothetical protein